MMPLSSKLATTHMKSQKKEFFSVRLCVKNVKTIDFSRFSTIGS